MDSMPTPRQTTKHSFIRRALQGWPSSDQCSARQRHRLGRALDEDAEAPAPARREAHAIFPTPLAMADRLAFALCHRRVRERVFCARAGLDGRTVAMNACGPLEPHAGRATGSPAVAHPCRTRAPTCPGVLAVPPVPQGSPRRLTAWQKVEYQLRRGPLLSGVSPSHRALSD